MTKNKFSRLNSLVWLAAFLGAAGLLFVGSSTATAQPGDAPRPVKGEFTLRFFPPGDECLPHTGAA